MLKVVQGGWVPLALGGLIMMIMYTWRRGNQDPLRQDPPAGDAARRSGAHARKKAAGARSGHARCSSPSDPKERAYGAIAPASSTTRCCTRRMSSSASRRTHTPRVDEAPSACNRAGRLRPFNAGDIAASGYMETPKFRRRARNRSPGSAGISTSCRRRFLVAPDAAAGAAFGYAALAGSVCSLSLARSDERPHGISRIPTEPGGEVGTQVTV